MSKLSDFRKIIFVLLIIGCFSCSKNDEEIPENKYLVDYTLKTNVSALTIKALVRNYGMEDLESLVESDIRTYVITYLTPYDGGTVQASGVIAVPLFADNPLPVISAHRGTIFAHYEAPSEQDLLSGYEIFSSAGFITLIPDMLGFGTSDNMIHPYYNYELTSSCVFHMIKAGEEFLRETGMESNGELYLYGYSEGGYITTATHREIELNYPEISLTAVASGAGSYGIPYVMDDIASREVFTSPSYLAFIIYSFNQYYGWQKSMEEFFNEPYASRIPALLDGSRNSGQINSQLNDTLEVLFTSFYLNSIRQGTENLLTGALEENRVDDWTPSVPTRFYHSPFDQYIPIEDTRNTYLQMLGNGGEVELIELTGGSHEEAGIEMTREAFLWFVELAGK